MRIGLWQIPYDEDGGWYHERIPERLEEGRRRGTDLVVFPECFPFWSGRAAAPTLERASRILARYGRPGQPAFIAGGYLFEGELLRNVVMLIHDGRVRGVYRKRWPWAGEGRADHPARITPGDELTLFTWDGGRCLPLICADLLCPEDNERQTLISEARTRGAGPEVPVVVCAYAARTRGKKWTSRLRQWAQDCNAPVALCNFAGVDPEGFGRGGSGVFWPGGRRSPRPRKPGLYIFDLT